MLVRAMIPTPIPPPRRKKPEPIETGAKRLEIPEGKGAYSVIVYKEGDYIIAEDYRGRKIAEGISNVDDAKVIQSLDGKYDVLKIIVLTDITAEQVIYFEKSKYLDIDFTGHTVLNKAGGDYAPFINYKVNDGVFIIKNVTVDNQNTVGDGITAGATGIYPKKIICENVTVKNFTNHGFYFRLADPTVGADENVEHDLILRNCKAETSSSLNEAFAIDNARKIIVENCEAVGNKIGMFIASEVYIKNFKYNTSDWGFNVRSRKAVLKDITGDGTGSNAYISIEVYGSPDLIYVYDSCYYAEIRGFRGVGNICRIQLRPYDDTYVLKHVVLDGITQKQTAILVVPKADFGTIENLEIRNVKFLEYSLQYHILRIINVTIKKLLIDGVELPGINATYTRALYIQNDKADREINAIIRNVTRTLPYVGQSDDKGAGFGVTGEFDVEPFLYNSFWQLTSGTSQPSLLKSAGIATFSGDGTTTTFTIPHGLVAEPKVVQVTPLSADASGQFYVTKDATNIYVNYITAPPAGTNNIVLSWYAEV